MTWLTFITLLLYNFCLIDFLDTREEIKFRLGKSFGNKNCQLLIDVEFLESSLKRWLKVKRFRSRGSHNPNRKKCAETIINFELCQGKEERNCVALSNIFMYLI